MSQFMRFWYLSHMRKKKKNPLNALVHTTLCFTKSELGVQAAKLMVLITLIEPT